MILQNINKNLIQNVLSILHSKGYIKFVVAQYYLPLKLLLYFICAYVLFFYSVAIALRLIRCSIE